MKTETCGNCGCAFSWDNNTLFGNSPKTEWFSYICPECAREKTAQARHEESEREAERRHQERINYESQSSSTLDTISSGDRQEFERQKKWDESPLKRRFFRWWNNLSSEEKSEYDLKNIVLKFCRLPHTYTPEPKIDIVDSTVLAVWIVSIFLVSNQYITKLDFVLFVVISFIPLVLILILVVYPWWRFVPYYKYIDGDLDILKNELRVRPKKGLNIAASVTVDPSKEVANYSAADLLKISSFVSANPKDLDSRLQLARVLNKSDDFESAMIHLLEIVRINKNWKDGIAKKELLAIFKSLEDKSPYIGIVNKYRTLLARTLY